MVDTKRTLAALQTLLADNVTEDISPQDVRDFLVSVYPVWTTYVPVWSATGTAPAIGNGTLTGRFLEGPNFVMGHVFFKAGSTTTFGTGSWRFTLPVNPSVADQTVSYSFGTVFAENAGVSGESGTSRLTYVATAPRMDLLQTGGTNLYSSTIPFGWADADYFTASFAYETAGP